VCSLSCREGEGGRERGRGREEGGREEGREGGGKVILQFRQQTPLYK